MSWQNLIREWLRRTAQQRVREAVAATGLEAPSGRSQTRGGTGPLRPAHFGVVASEKREAVGLIDRLDGRLTIQADCATVYEGGLHGRRLAIIVCGPDPQTAAVATEVLIDGHQPNWFISAGFCTALVSELAAGDVVLAEHVVSTEGSLPMCTVPGNGWRTGKLLSLPSVSNDPAERRHLAGQYGALAVDSHSYCVAAAAQQRNIPCAAVGVVRHALEHHAPEDADRVRRKQSLAGRVGMLTGLLWKRPRSLKTLWTEKEQDLVAGDRLADAVTKLMERLATGGGKEIKG